jgi:hypothetical protein
METDAFTALFSSIRIMVPTIAETLWKWRSLPSGPNLDNEAQPELEMWS